LENELSKFESASNSSTYFEYLPLSRRPSNSISCCKLLKSLWGHDNLSLSPSLERLFRANILQREVRFLAGGRVFEASGIDDSSRISLTLCVTTEKFSRISTKPDQPDQFALSENTQGGLPLTSKTTIALSSKPINKTGESGSLMKRVVRVFAKW